MVNELAIASEVSMYKVEIAFGRGLRMDLRSKDVVLVVSNEHGKMGELRISRAQSTGGPNAIGKRPRR